MGPKREIGSAVAAGGIAGGHGLPAPVRVPPVLTLLLLLPLVAVAAVSEPFNRSIGLDHRAGGVRSMHPERRPEQSIVGREWSAD